MTEEEIRDEMTEEMDQDKAETMEACEEYEDVIYKIDAINSEVESLKKQMLNASYNEVKVIKGKIAKLEAKRNILSYSLDEEEEQ